MSEIEFKITKEEFITCYEKNFFLKRAAISCDLLSWEEINQSLFSMEVATPKVKIFDHGQLDEQLYTETYTQIGKTRKRFNRTALHRYMKNGATLVLDRFDHNSITVKKLCDSVSNIVDAQTVANAYIAFGGDGTFGSHWDTHDVFAVQLRGRKRWQIFEPTFELPLIHQTSKLHSNERPELPVFDEILEAGDVLYIPRGWWHNVIPIGEETVHIAIGVHPPMMLHYLSWLCSTRLPNFLSARRSISRTTDHIEDLSDFINDINKSLFDKDNLKRFFETSVSPHHVENEFQLDIESQPNIANSELMKHVQESLNEIQNAIS